MVTWPCSCGRSRSDWVREKAIKRFFGNGPFHYSRFGGFFWGGVEMEGREQGERESESRHCAFISGPTAARGSTGLRWRQCFKWNTRKLPHAPHKAGSGASGRRASSSSSSLTPTPPSSSRVSDVFFIFLFYYKIKCLCALGSESGLGRAHSDGYGQ